MSILRITAKFRQQWVTLQKLKNKYAEHNRGGETHRSNVIPATRSSNIDKNELSFDVSGCKLLLNFIHENTSFMFQKSNLNNSFAGEAKL